MQTLKRKLVLIFILAALALGVFASIAKATWNPITFPRNGQWYATPGTYYDTPENLLVKHTAGDGCTTNFRLWLRRASDGSSIWQAPNAISLCIGSIGWWQWNGGISPDYPGGTRIWILAGPADGLSIGAYVCGSNNSPFTC